MSPDPDAAAAGSTSSPSPSRSPTTSARPSPAGQADVVLGPRRAGVLAHVTSIPGGRLGDGALRFVDWLTSAGVAWWQVLPLGPPDEHHSPYRSASAFAGWPGLLAAPGAPVSVEDEDAFRHRAGAWIDDWAAAAGAGSREAVRDQVRFDREWRRLRTHAADQGVRLIGDVPIYVAPGSVDHRAHPTLFRSGVVAGVPPDAFSDDGQLWGNPLFDWPTLRRQGYRWWVERLRRTFDLVDLTRIDHFRAFVAYWEVPASASTAREGRWVRGPGRAVFDAAIAALGPLPVIAEDLGVITAPVARLREDLGFPGMVVLQFGFDGRRPETSSPHHPANHREGSVCYSGTHDNDTARGWWATVPSAVHDGVRVAAREAAVDDVPANEPWRMVPRLALASRARLAVLPLQDVLGLGPEARMNLPGVGGGSWRWRADADQLTPSVAARLRADIKATDRLP